MADKETKFIGITLPKAWIVAIDGKTTAIKDRNDIIREALEPFMSKILAEDKSE